MPLIVLFNTRWCLIIKYDHMFLILSNLLDLCGLESPVITLQVEGKLIFLKLRVTIIKIAELPLLGHPIAHFVKFCQG